MAARRPGNLAGIGTSRLTPASPNGDARTGAVLRPADLKHAVLRFVDDSMMHHAAALTYYSLLSLFPTLLAGVAMLGLVGEARLIQEAADYLRSVAVPEETITTVTSAMEAAVSQPGSAATAIALGLMVSLWGAVGAFGAAGTALNVVLRVREERGFVRRKLNDVISTIAVLALATVTFLSIFLGDEVASYVFGLLGLGSTAEQIWIVVRWPAAIVCTILVYDIIYFAAPDVQRRRFRLISPGAVAGVVLWLAMSGAFFYYVSAFSRFSIIYGAFTAMVILLLWVWLTNVALLLGAELNAAIDYRRLACEPSASVSSSPPEDSQFEGATDLERTGAPT